MSPHKLLLACALASTMLLVPAALVKDASAATVWLNEVGSLRLISKHGFTLYERGGAAGTVRGTLYVRLTIVSSSRVTAELRLYRSGGSISGTGSASYQRGNHSATFAGSIAIDGGAGVYDHASGARLSFNGNIWRSNDSISVHVSGSVKV